MRKIMVLTGKRGGYGAMKPMLRLLSESTSVCLQLVCTDQHLSELFGKTLQEIQRDFNVIEAIDMQQEGSSPRARAQALARFFLKFSETLDRLQPDILVLYGDRGEVLAAAQVATCFNIPIAHLQGGDRTGSVDEQVRHAITKLSHLHFPSTIQSANRIISMGEDEWRTHPVGDSHVEEICKGNYMKEAEILEFLSLDPLIPIIVILQHSETTEPDESYAQMRATIKALKGVSAQKIVVYPCSDVGFEGVLKAIEEFALEEDNFRVYKNLDAPIFWGLLNIAKVLVGNSSAGIIESAYFNLPTLNIGRRQLNRDCPTNVIHVTHSEDIIRNEVLRLLSDEEYHKAKSDCEKIYGNGTTSETIFRKLTTISLNKNLLTKVMPY